MIKPEPSPVDDPFEIVHDQMMQSPRGRWFIAEFARRCGTPESSRLLAAIERLQGNVAAQYGAAQIVGLLGDLKGMLVRARELDAVVTAPEHALRAHAANIAALLRDLENHADALLKSFETESKNH